MHAEMGVRESRDLGQMRDADNLAAPAQPPQLFTQDFAAAAAHPDIYFIEDQHRDVIHFRKRAF